MHDVIIIGGSYAGLAAALQLGRARRRVSIIDAEQRRNRFARTSHGFLGHDGMSPSDIVERARAQVLAYPTVELVRGRATAARGRLDDFVVAVDGTEHHARRIVLASGVTDELPDVPGLRERWGAHVFHCPYCHGYELDRGRVGILATSELSMHQALLASQWAGEGQATFLLDGAFEPTAEQLADLARRGIAVERRRVTRIDGDGPLRVQLADDTSIALDGLFVASRTVITDPSGAELGCEREAGPHGAFYKTDDMKQTTVPGVFAGGDVGQAMSSVALAVASGTLAGISAHRSLVF
jgi:thioredoxin reductase